MSLYRHLFWPVLERLEPERAHELSLLALEWIQQVPFGAAIARLLSGGPGLGLTFEWKGVQFAGPVGIAAGWDKDGRVPLMAEAMGAGFIELGTVTPRPQLGNPRPRIFRVKSRKALVNRLGFPSRGAKEMAANLQRKRPKTAPVGLNISKNAATSIESAVDDYLTCMNELHEVADYFVINVSSPNTPGLTSLQSPGNLAALLSRLSEERLKLGGDRPKPLLIKLSSDLNVKELEGIGTICDDCGIDGAVAVNTSVDGDLWTDEMRGLDGGLSGLPIAERAVTAVEVLRANTSGDFLIVGVGGVFGAEDALRLLRSGADAVQIYTAMVYRGPGIIRELNRGLIEANWRGRGGVR